MTTVYDGRAYRYVLRWGWVEVAPLPPGEQVTDADTARAHIAAIRAGITQPKEHTCLTTASRTTAAT